MIKSTRTPYLPDVADVRHLIHLPDMSHPQKPFCGILNVDKPPGPTSHDVVAAVRRFSGQRRVGHAGTLDPMATGVLLVCLGRATRVSEYLMASSKTYRAAIHLGITTKTDDLDGEITGKASAEVTLREVETVLERFIGRISQVPPMYSAIKRGGKPLYKLARQGITLQVPPRPVEIHDLRIAKWTPPLLQVVVRCGPGTYIRALARDLGQALGCGAHLASLRRTQSGQFAVEQAVSLERLRKAFAAGTEIEFLHPPDVALSHLPALHLDTETARRLAMGQRVKGPGETRWDASTSGSTQARAYGPGGQFVAVVSRDEKTGSWQPRKVFVRPEDILLARPPGVSDAGTHE